MLSSIHPLGERAKGNRWGLTVSAFVMGGLIGGAAAGVVAGLVGMLVRSVVDPATTADVVLVGAVLVLCVALELRVFGVHHPTTRRQVDENWLNRYRGWVYGLGYGVQLGLGPVTIVSTPAIYAALALGVLTGSIAGGLAIGATFGLVRGAAVLVGRGVTSTDRLRRFHQRLDQRRRLAARLTPVAESAVAVAVLGAALLR
ncbi:MAG: hypothetical protein ACRD0G_07135 [Acidimicrobiales bacterium]